MRSYDKHSHNSARAYCKMLTIQGAAFRTGRDGNFITINSASCGVSENEEARIIIAHDHGAPTQLILSCQVNHAFTDGLPNLNENPVEYLRH